jgi:hypothetical protein
MVEEFAALVYADRCVAHRDAGSSGCCLVEGA